jgi:hypothetical protein
MAKKSTPEQSVHHNLVHDPTTDTRKAPTPPDIITYRLNGSMVYVTPAVNHEVCSLPSIAPLVLCWTPFLQQALDFAQKAFRHQLGGINRDRISFSVTVVTNGDRRPVRIAEMAWGVVVATLQQYEIIDIHVQPEVHIIDSDVQLRYLTPEERDSKEAAEFFSREGRQETARSCPPSRAQSRKSSPSARSLNSMEKGARGWLEKHVHFS